MGKRFFIEQYQLSRYSSKRAWLRLNEADFEPHRLRPYGLGSGNFTYRQMFTRKHQSRRGNRAQNRAVKKAARKLTRHHMREYQLDDD